MGSRNGNRRGALVAFAASAAFLVALFMVQPASADTITFVDTTDTIMVLHDGSQHTVTLFNTQTSMSGSCSALENYQCDVFIASPNHATTTTSPIGLNIAEPGVDPTQAVSDYVTTPTPLNSTSYLVIFASDPPGDPGAVLGLTPIAGAPSTSEDGGVQDAFTLSWSDGTTDTIRFQSDLDPVPEPGTIVLFGSGLASVIGLVRRKILTLV
jgi:hypothetical protein